MLVIKRKFGEIVKAKKYNNQVKGIKVKMLVYNINKNIINSFWLKLRISTKPKKQFQDKNELIEKGK